MLNRKQFLKVVSAAIASVPFTKTSVSAASRSKPNVLFIFADQMRFSAMSCMKGVKGADIEARNLETPNLDNLAASGTLFTHAYSATPVCSPYRTGLQTGKYSHTTTFKLHPGETTLPICFKKAGYNTGYVGKWHMSPATPESRSVKGPIRNYVAPENSVGWDFFAGHEVSHRYFGSEKIGALYFLNDDQNPKFLKEGEYEPEIQTDIALQFIEQQKDNPFLLLLSWGPPHNPYQPPKNYDRIDPTSIKLNPNVPQQYESQARSVLARYYGQIMSLDDQLGRIVEKIERTGQRENTIIWFSSDHGDMIYSQEDQNETKSPGMKRRPWEEAARIPGIVSWPGKVESGRESDMLFCSVDYMSTLLGLAGIPSPGSAQGQDLSNTILNQSDYEMDAIFLEQTAPGNTPYHSPWRAVRTREYLYAKTGHTENEEWLLYNMEEDPYQLINLVRNPQYEPIKQELQAKLVHWEQETQDTQDLRKEFLNKMKS